MKYRAYHNMDAEQYFWRTTQQQEIDFIEDINDQLFAYEFKWSPTAKAKFPSTFASSYLNAEFKAVSPKNIESFLL